MTVGLLGSLTLASDTSSKAPRPQNPVNKAAAATPVNTPGAQLHLQNAKPAGKQVLTKPVPPGSNKPVPGDNTRGGGNDACTGAIPLTLDVPVNDTTLGMTIDTVPSCAPFPPFSPGVWFSIVGNGSVYTATTCTPNRTYDTAITVFSGTCDALVCVGGNDDACDGLGSAFAWNAVNGTTYYILLFGFSSAAGSTDIVVRGPCELNCNDTEGEPDCSDGYVDVTNGGCNSVPPVFTPIACGQTVCGDAGTYIVPPGFNYRDTDWWLLNLATAQEVTWTVTAEFDALLFIVSPNPDCSNVILSAPGFTSTCASGSITQVVPAGQHYLFVATQGFSGVPCGLQYTGTVTCAEPPPPPPNDDCDDAAPIACGGTVSGTNVNALTDGSMSCVFDGSDVWYTFVATQNSATVSTCSGATFDTTLGIFDGCNGAQLACNDDFCGLQSQTTAVGSLTPGNPYLIRVASFGGGAQGDFTLSLTCLDIQPPPNDTCANAQLIACDSSTAGSNVGATNDGLQPSCSFGGAPTNSDVWYRFVATDNSATVSTCGGGSMSDTVITLYDACNGNEIRCNDDFCGLLSQFTAIGSLTPGSPYFIRVAGWNQEPQGTFTLDLTCLDIQPPTNDTCATATLVTCGSSTAGSNLGATDDGLQPSCTFGGAPTNSDVWYRFVANNNAASASTCGGGSMSDTVISVYSGADCNTLVEIACNDDFCGLLSEVVATGLTSGTQYWIRVAGWNQEPQGTFTLDVDCFDGNCAQAQPGDIPEGEPVCADGYVDNFNGGCNSVPPVYSNISVGDTVFGTGGNYLVNDPNFGPLQYRDTDWYRVVLPAPGRVTWTITAEFAAASFLIVPQPDCSSFSIPQALFPGFCETGVIEASLAAGEYWFFVATSGFAGVPCGAQYRASLEFSGACCLPTGCTITTESSCAAAGGSYVGDGTDCGGGSYVESSCNSPFEDISGTGTLLGFISGCDDCQETVAVGFPFPFYGATFANVNVGSNGLMTFGSSPATQFFNDPIPTPGGPDNMVAPFWDDFYTIIQGDVFMQTLAAPQRTIVQWNNVQRFPGVGTGNTLQAVLFASGDIEYRYGVLEGTPPLSGTVGVENADGSAGTSIDAAAIGTGNTCRHLTFVPGNNPCDACTLAGGTGQFCSADTDGDCELDVQDLSNLLAAFGSLTGDPNFNPAVDYDNSGSISLGDLAFLLGQFGDVCHP